MNNVEPIPQDVLIAARLKLKRRVAAILINALAEEGCSLEEVEVRLGRKSGFVWGYIRRLIIGKTREFDIVADLATGMGFEVVPGVQKVSGWLPESVETVNPEDQ